MKVKYFVHAALLLTLSSAVIAEPSRDAAVVRVPLASKAGTGPALATLIPEGARTRLSIWLGRTPQGLANPTVITEIREGACGSSMGATVFRAVETANQYTPGSADPGAVGETLGGNVPVGLSSLRGHAITLRTGPEAGDVVIACGNIG